MTNELLAFLDRALGLSGGAARRSVHGDERARLAAVLAARSADAAAEAAAQQELVGLVAASMAPLPADLAAEFSMGRGLRKILDALAARGAAERRNLFEIVLGQGREACEILVHTATDLVAASSQAWSFAAGPALVTRAGSAATATVEGVRETDAATATVTADRFEGHRHIDVVVRDLPAGPVPVVVLASDDDDRPPMTVAPAVEAGEAAGTVRLRYEIEDLPAGRYLLLIEEAATGSGSP